LILEKAAATANYAKHAKCQGFGHHPAVTGDVALAPVSFEPLQRLLSRGSGISRFNHLPF
jgi:hypothetical protein